MRFAKTVLAAAAMALACGAAFAADNDNKHHKGFNDMDKNADGKLTRAEAKGNKELLSRWKEADSNNDGVLTRAEYLKLMAKVDANKVKEKVSGAPEAVKKETAEAKRRAPDANASAGSTATVDNPKPQ
jgi:Ca2+-binding EF-hand superfamily protein